MTAKRTQQRRVRDLRKYLAEQQSPSAGYFGDQFAITGLRRTLTQAGFDKDKIDQVIERHQRFTPVQGADTRWRAQYLLKASGRDVSDETERRWFTQHVQADYDRIFSKMRIQAATQQYGPIVGWYAKDDDRVTPECAYADGKNFDPLHPPPWGLPGIGTHHGCRCVPGPPHEGAEVLDQSSDPGVHGHSVQGVHLVDLGHKGFDPLQPRGRDGRWIKIGSGSHADTSPPRRLGDRRKISPGKHTVVPTGEKPSTQGMPKPQKVIDRKTSPQVRKSSSKPIPTAPKGPDKEAVRKAVKVVDKPKNDDDLMTRLHARAAQMRKEAEKKVRRDGGYNLGRREDVDSHINFDGLPTNHRDAATDVRAAINEVHGDGGLPDIVTTQASGRHNGEYDPQGDLIGRESISLNRAAERPRMTLTHEIGHFIDFRGIGFNEHNFGTHQKDIFERNKVTDALARWHVAVVGTDSYKRGTANADRNRQYYDYWSSVHELWARSYAQWIASKSSNTQLRLELRRQQMKDNETTKSFPQQWSRRDFEKIMPLMDDVFRAQGWLK